MGSKTSESHSGRIFQNFLESPADPMVPWYGSDPFDILAAYRKS